MDATPLTNGKRTQEEPPLRRLWHFVGRNRWLVLGVPVLVLAATALFTSRVTPVYQALATIRIDEERSNVAVLDVLQSLSKGSEIDTEMEELRSRTLAEAVVDSLQLRTEIEEPRRVPRSELFSLLRFGRSSTGAEYRLTRQEDGRFQVFDGEAPRPLATVAVGQRFGVPDGELELAPAASSQSEIRLRVLPFWLAVERFRRELEVSRPNRDANIIAVRYSGTDPVLVERVPNVTAREFVRHRQRVQTSQARGTVGFLDEQLDTLTSQLSGAEDRLQAFQQSARVIAPEEEAKVQVERLADLQAQRELANSEREALAKLLQEVRDSSAAQAGSPSPMRRLIAFPQLLRNQAVGELLRALADVETKRAELLNRRTMDDPDVQVLTARIHELEDQIGAIASTYLMGLSNQVASFDRQLQRYGAAMRQVPRRQVEYARLKRRTSVLSDIYDLLATRRKEAEIAAAVQDASIRVVDPAILPHQPIRPNLPLNLGLGLLVGLVLGAGAAFGREQLDNSVRTRDELQHATRGVPVLGTIPTIREAAAPVGVRRVFGRRARRSNGASMPERLVAGRDPQNPVSEAYRSLRTNITFSSPDRPPKSLVFTSPGPGDGKSTSTSNLAITLAQQGLRVLLVDADLRRGVLNEVFRQPREPGLSNVLVGGVDLDAATLAVDVGSGSTLDFLPTGVLPPNPAELLGSARMEKLLERLVADYDAVLLDAPPLNLVTDAAILGTKADGVIVVARSGSTDRDALAYAVEQLEAVHAPVLGTLLNDVDARRDRYYGGFAPASYYYARDSKS